MALPMYDDCFQKLAILLIFIQVNAWTILSGGLFAAAAAMAAFAFKGSRTETSEQIAMLAAAGKKGNVLIFLFLYCRSSFRKSTCCC